MLLNCVCHGLLAPLFCTLSKFYCCALKFVCIHVLVNGSVSLNHAAKQLIMYGADERPVTIKHT